METQTSAAANSGFATPVLAESLPIGRPGNLGSLLAAGRLLPLAATAVAFGLLFAKPITFLVRDWWNLPEAGHGLLLAPVALWLAWRSGIDADSRPSPALGICLLVLAVVVRGASGLAAELFTMR